MRTSVVSAPSQRAGGRRWPPPFAVVWTACLLAAVVAVVLAIGQPWEPTPTPFDPQIAAAASARWDAAHSQPTKVTVIGDSYTGGSLMGGSDQAHNWVFLAAGLLQKQKINIEVNSLGAGGSGYVATGQTNRTFDQLIPGAIGPDTKLIVFFGSRNDAGYAATVERSAARAFADAKRASPTAKLLVIGPPWTNGNPPASLLAARDGVQAATVAAGGVFVDPLADHWFTGPDSKLISTDGVQPTDAGHAYMAAKIAPQLAAILHD